MPLVLSRMQHYGTLYAVGEKRKSCEIEARMITITSCRYDTYRTKASVTLWTIVYAVWKIQVANAHVENADGRYQLILKAVIIANSLFLSECGKQW